MRALALSGRKLFYTIHKTELVPRIKHAASSSPRSINHVVSRNYPNLF